MFHSVDKIILYLTSSSSIIFEYDYLKMEMNCDIFKDELIAYICDPSRIFRNISTEGLVVDTEFSKPMSYLWDIV